jgi:hypothetical protein
MGASELISCGGRDHELDDGARSREGGRDSEDPPVQRDVCVVVWLHDAAARAEAVAGLTAEPGVQAPAATAATEVARLVRDCAATACVFEVREALGDLHALSDIAEIERPVQTFLTGTVHSEFANALRRAGLRTTTLPGHLSVENMCTFVLGRLGDA